MPAYSLPLLNKAVATPTEADPRLRSQWPVVLVTMPFMDADRPSIQLGLLAAILRGHGFPARTLHANLDFAVRLGVERYHRLGERRSRMVADWLFSVAAFGAEAPDPDGRLLDDFAADLAYLGDAELARETLLRIRDEDVPAYLDALVDGYDWEPVRVVGFSSTFQQNTASFALARRLKQRFPRIVTVFGGANFDGEMGPEWIRAVDCVDVAVVGEGDVALPRLMHALATGAGPAGLPGIACRVDGAVVSTVPEAALTRLDESPSPDYDEFFERAAGLGLLPAAGPTRVRLPFESARGCWWGAKHHCTFCGLNGSTMQFRAKSPERVAGELVTQARRYRTFRFEAVDNIVDMSYLKQLFPAFIEQETGFELFYEVKANLSRDQVRTLAHAGVSAIQPGIESLSSHVLALMNKGVRAAQNINLLRWARYYGIDVSWNIIWGFPGETEQDYAEQAALLPHLAHLPAPAGTGRLWLERFSPLYRSSPGKLPEHSYRYIYPPAVELGKVAYFFEYDLPGALPDATYEAVSAGAARWRAAGDDGHEPVLRFWAAPGFVQIYDGRHAGAEGTYTFEGPVADLYAACSDRPLTAQAAYRRLDGRLPAEAVQQALIEYARRGLMVLDGDLALALALPAGVPR
ncbi:RiPP maturation radical SAM C-methyltransferase [Actinoplanes sp. NPDC049599]|uniref:RiPP maturation radical SAM C-methyltransferase n=1 Tax=Actinoplanes sp. NPDC049599 TaxID=3363903 RepID=UPI0037B7BE15